MQRLVGMIKESMLNLGITKIVLCCRHRSLLFSSILFSELSECNLEFIETKYTPYENVIEKLSQCNENEILIICFPLFKDDKKINKSIFKCCMMLEEKGVYMINISESFNSESYNKISLLYDKLLLKIISCDDEKITKNNDRIYDDLNKANDVILKNKDGVHITFKSSGIILKENYQLTKSQRVVQIPAGEVFLVPEEGSVNGIISIDLNNKKYKFKVLNDFVYLNIDEMNINGNFPICEIGFGTNPFVPDIDILPFKEKRYGTFHLGFGNNVNFGGNYCLDYHFDIVFDNPQIMIVNSDNN